MRTSKVLHHVPQADDVESPPFEVVLQELAAGGLEAEPLPGKLDPLPVDVDPGDCVEALAGEVEEEPVGAPDLQEAPAPRRVEELLERRQPSAEVLLVDPPVGEVVAVLLAKEVLPAVEVEHLLVGELRIGEDERAAGASQDPGAVLFEPLAAAKNARRRHGLRCYTAGRASESFPIFAETAAGVDGEETRHPGRPAYNEAEALSSRKATPPRDGRAPSDYTILSSATARPTARARSSKSSTRGAPSTSASSTSRAISGNRPP